MELCSPRNKHAFQILQLFPYCMKHVILMKSLSDQAVKERVEEFTSGLLTKGLTF